VVARKALMPEVTSVATIIATAGRMVEANV
jgi:hypothetical protein